MDISFVFMAFIFIGVFFAAYGCFWLIYQRAGALSAVSFFKYPFGVFLAVGFVGCCAVLLINQVQTDALYETKLPDVCFAFIGSCLIWLSLQKISNCLLRWLVLPALCLVGMFFVPSTFLLCEGYLPFWVDRTLLFVLWVLFAAGYKYMNGSDGLLNIESLSVAGGVFLLCVCGVLSVVLGDMALVLIAVMLAFNFFNNYPSRLVLSDNAATAYAFLLGWLYVKSAQEGVGACILILNMYYIYEILLAGLKKLSMKPQYKKLRDNTFYGKLSAMGVSPKFICDLAIRINILLIVMAGLQIYAPNRLSLSAISFFMVIWYTSRSTSEKPAPRNIVGVSVDFARDISQGIKDAANAIKKDK